MEDIILESFPFDSLEILNEESGQMEFDRLYEAKIFRQYFKKFLSNGVYFGDYKEYKENSMKVSLEGGMNIKVAAGAGFIEGADFENTEDQILTLERPANANRIDRIVVRFDATLDKRNTFLIVKKGNGETPAPLQRNENIYEICLAEVTVRSTSNITENDIVDKRLNKELCGIVDSLISVDGEELLEEFRNHIHEMADNFVLKNEDTTITGVLTFENGLIGNIQGNLNGNVKGDVEGNVQGDLIGNVTGNCSGSSNSCTGNARNCYEIRNSKDNKYNWCCNWRNNI